MRMTDGEGSTYTSVKKGGGQIEFEDEDPEIHRQFEAALAKVGAQAAWVITIRSVSTRRHKNEPEILSV